MQYHISCLTVTQQCRKWAANQTSNPGELRRPASAETVSCALQRDIWTGSTQPPITSRVLHVGRKPERNDVFSDQTLMSAEKYERRQRGRYLQRSYLKHQNFSLGVNLGRKDVLADVERKSSSSLKTSCFMQKPGLKVLFLFQ